MGGQWGNLAHNSILLCNSRSVTEILKNSREGDLVHGSGIGKDLLAECETRSTAYLLGEDPEDRINVRQLFLRQTRSFPKMPKNAGDLLGVYGSEPMKL